MPPPPSTLPHEPATPAGAGEGRIRFSRAEQASCTARNVLGFSVYGLLALLVTAVCVVASAGARDRAHQKVICQRIIHWGVRHWARFSEWIAIYRVDFPEIDTLRAMRGTVFAPNHISLIDATHFIARMPRLTCVMKSSIRRNPFMAGSSALAGYLPNDNNKEFIRQGRDALRAGGNLLIFPEGTRTVRPPVNGFKKGFALIATLAEAPVQTVFVQMPVQYMGKRWPLWRAVAMPVPVTLRLGKLFPPQPGRTAKALAAELEEYFRATLEETPGGGVRVRPPPAG